MAFLALSVGLNIASALLGCGDSRVRRKDKVNITSKEVLKSVSRE
jgi:hypothetical protein